MALKYETRLFINTDTSSYTKKDNDCFLNAYALSKNQFALWGKHISKECKISFVNIRLEQLYGDGDDNSKFTTWIINSCFNNQPVIELTSGEQRRDFIFIDDAIEAYGAIVQNSQKIDMGYTQIGLGTGQSVTVRQFVETGHNLSKSKSELCFGALPYRPNEYMDSHADTKILNDLEWKPKTSLEDGIKRIISNMKNNRYT
jgi:CDP-paratose synthetase